MLKAYTTSKYNCLSTVKLIFLSLFFLLSQCELYSQQSLDLPGTVQSIQNRNFRLNSLESNPGNSFYGKDWEISAMFSSSKQIKSKTSLYSLALSKKIDNHYFYARFTPGYAEEFIFNSGLQVILTNPVRVETQLQKKVTYNEDLGLGYSYKFAPTLSAGISFRYFKQNFSEDTPSPVITDSVNYIAITKNSSNSNFWRGDIGVSYQPIEWFSISASSINLMIAEENSSTTDSELFTLKKKKGIALFANANFARSLGFTLGAETSGSFLTGIKSSIPIASTTLNFGITVFHDKYQNPFIAGMLPAINYSTKLFSVTLGALKYFEKRNRTFTITDLTSTGIYSLTNNQFSDDQIFLGVNMALSFIHEQLARIEDLSIETEIYPALSEIYSDKPIATAKVANISDKTIVLRPASLIPELNKEKIYSPSVTIEAGKTSLIPFYTLIDGSEVELKRREIKQAEFYIESEGVVEDEIKKPILVNDLNAWDGDVNNLKYFVKRDLNYSAPYAKAILSLNEKQLNNTASDLKVFEKTKILFDNILAKMIYVADRRASAEIVQFPSETINLRGGDCDDLSVCFASILESIGIETAFVDYQNDESIYHVNLLVNTGLLPEQISLITNNDKKVAIRKNNENKDYVWIPIETTSFKDFASAWSIASQKYETEAVEQLGLAKGKIRIIDAN